MPFGKEKKLNPVVRPKTGKVFVEVVGADEKARMRRVRRRVRQADLDRNLVYEMERKDF